MTHHQAFLAYIQQHGQAVDLMRVCRAYKTSTDNFAFELNGRLKGGLPPGEFYADLQILMGAICGKLSEPITLYRMTSNIDFCVPGADAMRGEFKYQAFMSTTSETTRLTRFIPKHATPLLLEIVCPAGFALAPMDLFPGTDEDEYLFGCGTTFKVLEGPRKLDAVEARELVPSFAKPSMDFLRLEVVQNPPYVIPANLVTL